MICIDPVILEDVLSARIGRTDGRRGCTGNRRARGCGACRDLGLGLASGDRGGCSRHGRELLFLEIFIDRTIHIRDLEIGRRLGLGLLLLLLVWHSIHGEREHIHHIRIHGHRLEIGRFRLRMDGEHCDVGAHSSNLTLINDYQWKLYLCRWENEHTVL